MVWIVDFEVNQTKIKGGCQSERKVVTHDSMSDLPLERWKSSTKAVNNKIQTFLRRRDVVRPSLLSATNSSSVEYWSRFRTSPRPRRLLPVVDGVCSDGAS